MEGNQIEFGKEYKTKKIDKVNEAKQASKLFGIDLCDDKDCDGCDVGECTTKELVDDAEKAVRKATKGSGKAWNDGTVIRDPITGKFKRAE